MTRDVKHMGRPQGAARESKIRSSSRHPQKPARGGTMIGLFLGLVIGVGLAAGVAWYVNKSPVPFVNKVAPGGGGATPSSASANASSQNPGTAQGAAATNSQNAGKGGSTQAPANVAALPGKPGDPPPEKRFDFYDILQGKKEALPQSAPVEEKKEAKEARKEEKKEEKKEDVKKDDKKGLLQAGSFQQAVDADNLKAKLALMGMEASVQQVMVDDKVWYRVRLGPYSADELHKIRSELAKSGINASAVKKN